jgi:DAK2 domain fusion protein YloV
MEVKPTEQNQRARFLQQPIDGQVFKELVAAGLNWLRANSALVNALNVFPVPDGDTGTNMVLTMQSAYEEIEASSEHDLGRIMQELAQGALMGARGNSGVILSQLWRGFAHASGSHSTLTPEVLARSFSEARDTAYRGVVRPVEGTILTVSKDMAAAAEQAASSGSDVVSLLEQVVEEGALSVERTPDLLPILKDAGVVDSGGKGLYFIFEGMLRYINGLQLEEAELVVKPLSSMDFEGAMQEVEEGQDYEVIVDFRPNGSLDLKGFYVHLEEMGTSIQVGEGDGMYRVHIHVPTENRYLPIDYAMSIGTITKVHIENLMDQMDGLEAESEKKIELPAVQPGQIGVVAVSPGKGISRVFASLGVNALVAGGQTMNPSTKEIVSAFEDLPCDRVIILPNNKNIIMAAEGAREVSVKKVAVIPSRTIPQGLAAMLAFNPEGDFEDVVSGMQGSLQDVESGEITTATRTVEIDGVSVNEGSIISLHNGKLVASADTLLEGCLKFLQHAQAEDCELITLFYGADIRRAEAEQIAAEIQKAYPEHEIELQSGGQAHYQFIFSVE